VPEFHHAAHDFTHGYGAVGHMTWVAGNPDDGLDPDTMRNVYCLAMVMRIRSSGSMRWSWSSSPRSICTQLIFPVNRLVRAL